MITFFPRCFVSFLPASMRVHWTRDHQLQYPCAFSALAEIAAAAYFLLTRYPAYYEARTHHLQEMALAHTGVQQASIATQGYSFALSACLEYAMQPLTIFLLLLCIEGMVRLPAALITEHVLPSTLIAIPFHGTRWLLGLFSQGPAPRPRQMLEPLQGGTLLLVHTFERQPAWTHSMTFEHRNKYFEIAEEGERNGSAYCYTLRPISSATIVRRVLHWSSEEGRFVE